MCKIAIALALLLGLANGAAAQAPPAVPALPDSSRVTTYSLSASNCACSVGFALYGSGNDVDEWIQVYVNGVAKLSTDLTYGWSLSSATGALATIPRPITNAVLTFNSVQTAAVIISGSERPRRLSQFSENRGVAARDLNQAVTDAVAVQRELWDKANRSIVGQPGEVFSALPPPANRLGGFLAFDGTTGLPIVTAAVSGGGNVIGPNSAVSGDFACWNNSTGTLLKDCGSGPINVLGSPYFADKTGVLDAGVVINNALVAAQEAGTSTTQCVYVPGGKYKLSEALFLNSNGACLIGDGPNATVICVVGNGAVVHVAATGTYARVSNMTVENCGTPGSGSIGVQADNGVGGVVIDNVLATNNYVGFLLGGTGRGDCYKCTAASNLSDGFQFTNNMANQVMQWVITSGNSFENGGWGINANSTLTILIVGPYLNGFWSVSDTSGGVKFGGASGTQYGDQQINNVTISGPGGGGGLVVAPGPYLAINNLFIESAGQFPTGPALGTAAALTGTGVTFTGTGASGAEVNMNNVIVRGNSDQGIYFPSGVTMARAFLTDVHATVNGQNTINTIGIDLENTTTVYTITGSDGWNLSGETITATQTYGLKAATGGNVYLNQNDFNGNLTGGCLFTSGTPNGTSLGTNCQGALSLASIKTSSSANGSNVFGTSGTTLSAAVPYSVHVGTNENLYLNPPVDLGSGVFMGIINDAAAAYVGLEVKASQVYFNTGVGPVSIGTTSTTGTALNVSGTVYLASLTTSSAAQTAYACISSTNQLVSVAVANTCATSAEEFKEDINPLDLGLDTVLALKPIEYHYRLTGNENFDYAPNQRSWQIGFGARQAADVDERLTTVDGEGNIHSFRYEQFSAVLARAIQQLKADNDNLRSELETLKKRQVH
jgi:Chaperone of endosialidase